MKKRNLSLTEMLIVVGIIILLFTIGVPAVIKGMQRGELTECKGNLSQLAKAVAVYVKDNKNYFPYQEGNAWVANANDPISEYIGGSYDNANTCPSNPDEDESYRASATSSITTDLNTDGNKGLKSSKVKRPATMSLFVSKEVYNQGSITEQWHEKDNTYPFVNVGGSVISLTFTSADLSNANKANRYDFKND
ncbi:type II secretion system protein [Lentisphaera marina]|uniref:type II secretion system protein n=1 Tax=Lentisphaera marina TaxID=1111041 RepID=UPI002366D2F9|nr:type II secretion system protein [Lentisphaera marina]MDD7985675.1 type II secretion system protein [Lentisphaera marina]